MMIAGIQEKGWGESDEAGKPAHRPAESQPVRRWDRRLLAGVGDLHHLEFLAVRGEGEHVHHVVVVVDDLDLLAHGALLAGQEVIELGVQDAGVTFHGAFAGHPHGAHAVHPDVDVFLLVVVVAHEAEALEGLAHHVAIVGRHDVAAAEHPVVGAGAGGGIVAKELAVADETTIVIESEEITKKAAVSTEVSIKGETKE